MTADNPAHPAAGDLPIGSTWPGELTEDFTWYPDLSALVLPMQDTSPSEREALLGSGAIAVIARAETVGFRLRLGRADWMSTLARRPDGPVPPALLPDAGTERLELTVNVVTPATKTLTFRRHITLSPHVTRTLRREVADRWATTVDATLQDRWDDDPVFPVDRASCRFGPGGTRTADRPATGSAP